MFLLTAFSPQPALAASQKPSAAKAVDSFTITQRGDRYRINISYPLLGHAVADAELSIWAREQATAFAESVQMLPAPMPLPYELSITYETIKASSKVVSVIFYISASMGGAHPEPGLATFVYAARDGRRLSYADLFTNQDGMLQTFSEICRDTLAAQLGERVADDMLKAGTTPDMANFDLFVPTASGLRIYFPPYQAAPYSEGYLNVAIPLEKLSAFKPQLSFWDKD
ncbi:DUF3298 and DUF4163 domain-containing protein [Desulfovibrio sp. OttesenSCG-928-O18]|nr:DUF3298 and DUF4163 domain-containing protein [Desulfovibrio sp. OttesenSCG-928-O18]